MLRALSVSALIFTVLALTHLPETGTQEVLAKETNCGCEQTANTDTTVISNPAQCKNHKPASQSWLSWLRGKSRSTQFHFLDLVELLNSTHISAEARTAHF